MGTNITEQFRTVGTNYYYYNTIKVLFGTYMVPTNHKKPQKTIAKNKEE